jgi:pyruvate/2-oxoglutarate dehydrogenase complex dihydrolipoamide dehydrogenase (E3) component
LIAAVPTRHREEMPMTKYDAIVIGSGQAGNPLSQKLADQGWTVALIESDQVGGTCINTGCTPTKTMVASAQVAYYVRNAAKWGVHAGAMRVDLAEVVARKQRMVMQWRAGQERRIGERPKLRLYRGHARFIAPHRLSAGAEELESERIFINAGTRVAPPKIEGLDQVDYLTNASIMELREIPEHLVVLGGGYIGLEFGQMFRRFGSEVTIVDHAEQIIAHEDRDVSGELRKALEAEGIRFVMSAGVSRVAKQNGKLQIELEVAGQNISLAGTHLLVATGRRPNTDDLGVEAAGLALDNHGYIKVNGRLETNVPGIWALGDVKGGPAFTHISYNDYQIVYGNLIEGKTVGIEHRVVPYSVFTDPELGRVGMTEAEARAAGRQLKIGKIPLTQVARAMERDETAGLMKIVVDAADDRILGAAILCTNGGELVQTLGAVMMAGAPYTLLKGAVYIHPTLAEGFFALMEEVRPVP